MRSAPLFLALAAAACASEPSAPPAPWPASPDRMLSTSGDRLLATGVGKPDPRAAMDTQRRSTSRDAALADARARLRAYLQSVFKAEEGAAVLDRLAQAALPVSTRWDADATATAVLSLEKARVNEALESSYR